MKRNEDDFEQLARKFPGEPGELFFQPPLAHLSFMNVSPELYQSTAKAGKVLVVEKYFYQMSCRQVEF